MKLDRQHILAVPVLVALAVGGYDSARSDDDQEDYWSRAPKLDREIDQHAQRALTEGRQIFRFDTFGDEAFWGDTIKLHQTIQGKRFGGVGPGVSPRTALAVGLKVDVDALPDALIESLRKGRVNLDDPAITLALLKLNAVVGVTGFFSSTGGLQSMGIQCALCHSTVDNSFAPGIGKRLDGWPNHDLNPGAIIALSPALTAAQKSVYNSWGPGKYDPRYNFDGKNGPQVIPPAYGLLGLNSITVTGDGADVQYWNRYVGVTQMHGHGSFSEPRTGVNVQNPPDSISPLLPALQQYQLSLSSPPPPAGSFDAAAAARGQEVFTGAGKCSTCHTGSQLTDANTRLHPPSDVVSEPEPNGAPSYASRSATKMYRTAPLHGLWQHPPYFHNGIAPTLEAVVELYNTKKGLGLTAQQKADLVQYLKSL